MQLGQTRLHFPHPSKCINFIQEYTEFLIPFNCILWHFLTFPSIYFLKIQLVPDTWNIQYSHPSIPGLPGCSQRIKARSQPACNCTGNLRVRSNRKSIRKIFLREEESLRRAWNGQLLFLPTSRKERIGRRIIAAVREEWKNIVEEENRALFHPCPLVRNKLFLQDTQPS